MTVLHSVVGRVQPGRYDEFLSQSLEVSKLYERHGAENIRLMQAVSAGEATNSWTFSSEFENAEAYGAFTEELTADLEMQNFLTRMRAANSPVTVEQISLASEVPLERKGKQGRGDVVEVHVSRIIPGRFEEAIKLTTTACNFAERKGARHGRLFQLSYAGLGSGLFMVSWEYANLRAAGKAMDGWNTDPKGQAIAARMYGPEASTTLVFSGLYTTIPI